MLDLRAEVRRRLAAARLAPAREADVTDEIVQHLEDRHAELLARGLSAAEAEGAVLTELEGSELVARELARLHPARVPPPVPGARSGRRLGDLWGDLRYGMRALSRSRGFTVVTLLSLALGVGATVSIFQFVDALELRALPSPHPEELAIVKFREGRGRTGSFNSWHPHLTNPLWEKLRERQDAFSSLFAWGNNTFNLNPRGESRWAHALMVSGDFFRVLGVEPALGRFFSAEDDRRGCANPGLVISHGFWQRELGGDPAVVGRTITLDGHPVVIIGVTPPGFFGPEVGHSFDVAVPLCMERVLNFDNDRLDNRHGWWLSVMGRLKPGWTIERASAHLDAISRSLLEPTVPPEYPRETRDAYLSNRLAAYPAATGLSDLRDRYSTPLYFLLGIAGLLLLIACANLANLLLARASAREREIAVRLALGASRGRLIRQLLAESLLLALLGGALGLVVARALGEFLVVFLRRPGRPALFVDLDPDARVLAFALGLALLTCLLFGLMPALRASNTEVGLVLKTSTGHGATERGGGFALRRVLVVVQVALSFVLLVGALLFGRSLHKLVTVDAGFRPEGVLVVDLDLTPLDLPRDRDRRVAFQEQLLERLRAVPGVAHAATATIVPISGSGWDNKVWRNGGEHIDSNFNRVSPGYFATLSTPLLAGRDFENRDRAGAPKVVIVNQTLARRAGLGPNPVGQHIYRETGISDKNELCEIVGLVRDTKYREMREPFPPITFVPLGQDEEPDVWVQTLVSSPLPPANLMSSVRSALTELAPALRMDLHRMETDLQYSLLRERMMAVLAAFFGALAALLASIGLYGVIAYSVARRSQEIGIRMALGADPVSVSRMIVGEAGRLLGVGLLCGVALALLAGRATSALLFGLAPHDPLTFGLAIVLLAGVALLASALPARRAARVDPISVLRNE